MQCFRQKLRISALTAGINFQQVCLLDYEERYLSFSFQQLEFSRLEHGRDHLQWGSSSRWKFQRCSRCISCMIDR